MIEIKMKNAQNIILVYRPPDGSVDIALEQLSDLIHVTDDGANREIFIIGDLNIVWSKKCDPHTKKLLHFLNDSCIKQFITEKTRCTPLHQSTIAY